MTKLKRYKTYCSGFIVLVLLLVSAFTLPPTVVFSAAGDPLTITITSPVANSIVKPSNDVISGAFTYDSAQPSTPLFKAFDGPTSGNSISDSTSKLTEWAIDGTKGTWSYTPAAGALTEGTHTISISITDSVSVTNSTSVTFTIDSGRPFVSNTGVIFKDGTNQYTAVTGDTLGSVALNQLGDKSYWTDIAQLNKITSPDVTRDTALPDGTVINLPARRTSEDLTGIPEDAIMKVTLTDDKPMTQLVSKIQNTASPFNPFSVLLGSTSITGKATIFENKEKENNNYVYDLFFTPDSALTLNKTYLVYLDQKNSNLVDDSNGPVYAKFFKFTTKSNAEWDDIDNQNHDSSNPHGHYQLNTNMCSACHSTHVNSPYQKDMTTQLNPSREGGSYLVSFNDKLSATASENYCTACHDGTLNNAPTADGLEGAYHHDNPADYDKTNGTNNLKEATSCTSCHNPHLEWTSSNPNLLKDHYVYTHKEVIKDQNGTDVTVIDSLDTPCEICHEDDLIHDSSTNTVSSIFVKNNQTTDGYIVLSYKKSLTVEGTVTAKATDPNQNTVMDYALCLRCHSANKNSSDIEKYYVDSASGHNFALPSDDGGSKLNGPIPCAECHKTHGSDNIKMLRERLGNDLSLSKFSTTSTTWIASDERNFCLKCHNNSTEIYGKTGIFNTKTDAGVDIQGHQSTDTSACSSCHGTGTTDAEKALSAAHDPKKTP